jgi:hypothetical protein
VHAKERIVSPERIEVHALPRLSTKERIVSPERIEVHAKHWKDVDYLIFNTYIWWMNNVDIKVRSTPTSHSLTGNA